MVYNWQKKGTPVITGFIYHAPLNLEFYIITHFLPFPLKSPPYLLLFATKIPAQKVKTLVYLSLHFV